MTYNIDESIIARSIDHYGEEIQATVCRQPSVWKNVQN